MFLVVGLGNPGEEYAETRHNVGFMVVDRIAAQSGKDFHRPAGAPRSVVCPVERAGKTVLLAKPQTFMNRSGLAARELFSVFPIEIGQSLVIFDDVALPLGVIRIRASGSAGGQKGMQSWIEALGTRDIPRLRIGINGNGEDLAEFVLRPFKPGERKILEQVLDRAVDAVDTVVSDGLDRAMSLFNPLR